MGVRYIVRSVDWAAALELVRLGLPLPQVFEVYPDDPSWEFAWDTVDDIRECVRRRLV